jgi:hypothetical protein
LYAVKRMLKVIEDVWSIDQEPPCFLYTVLRGVKSMMVMDVNQEPLADLYALVR